MKMYHYVHGKRRGVYDVEPGYTVERILHETRGWPGTRFVVIQGGKH